MVESIKKISKEKQIISGNYRFDLENRDKFDLVYDYPRDVIHFVFEKVYSSKFREGKLYRFGYVFNEDISSAEKARFIHYLSGMDDIKMPAYELRQFLEIPLNDLHSKVNMYSIDCFVYPVSGRSLLVQKMVEVINEYTSRKASRVSYELVKSAPTNIGFDWDMFNSNLGEYVGTNRSNMKKLNKLKGKKIFVLDDINTSGSTLNEILRILQKINTGCDIFIYTLIGNRISLVKDENTIS